MKKKIIMTTVAALLLSGCGMHQINPTTPESKDEAKNFKNQEIYDKAVRENKDKWVNLGYTRAMHVAEKYTDDIKSYEAGKYAVKSKFITYPKVVATNINGKLTLQTQPSEIKRDMSIKDIFDFYGKNADLVNTSPAYANTPQADATSEPTLQSAALGVPVLNKPKPARFYVSTPTRNTKFKKPNQSQFINSNRNKQISITLPKTQKSINAINEYSLKCLEHNNKYTCDFANKMERDYFCSETRTCR